MDVEETEVVVVGAGPIGLEMAIALQRADIDYLQFDAKQIGYTVSWTIRTSPPVSTTWRISAASCRSLIWRCGRTSRSWESIDATMAGSW